jgi:hypothetical protein
MELLRVVDDDTQSPRYLRHFSDTPSAIIRLGLESELARASATRAECNVEGLEGDRRGARICTPGAVADHPRLTISGAYPGPSKRLTWTWKRTASGCSSHRFGERPAVLPNSC